MGGKPIVQQHRAGAEMILVRHHQPLRQQSHIALKCVHVDVQRKAVYTLAVKQDLRKGNRGGVGGGQKQFHPRSLTAILAQVKKKRAT